MYSIAIDGTASAGKSTLARSLARRLGYVYVDTGAIYRSVGLACERAGVAALDEAAICKTVLPTLWITLESTADGAQITRLNGEDVSTQIRRDAVSRLAMEVSGLASVRDFLLELQREFARTYDVVMEGRDIGTVVLPDATVKIYLTANPQVRAMRRTLELERRGEPKPYDEVLSALEERDANNTDRAIAPLRVADGAIVLDTSELSESGALEAALAIVRRVIG
ncbi:MAG: (d)CMP kinase [Oscillospiraceae bacterium]|nr:(d)CMP kinase [Oscillospiraceae bacterium]